MNDTNDNIKNITANIYGFLTQKDIPAVINDAKAKFRKNIMMNQFKKSND